MTPPTTGARAIGSPRTCQGLRRGIAEGGIGGGVLQAASPEPRTRHTPGLDRCTTMKNSTSQPPSHLSAAARAMWRSLVDDYYIEDGAGLALLRVACEAFDRGEQARRIIKREGAVLKDRFGQRKQHPATLIERDAKTQMVAALRALKLEPGDAP